MIKKLINKALSVTGYEIRKIQPVAVRPNTPDSRPVGVMYAMLEDLKTRGLKCENILDIGAHIGDWSRMAKTYFPSANFCLIEPQIEMKEHLENFVLCNPGSVYFIAGAGAKKETLTFTVWDDFGGSSFLPEADLELKNANKQRDIEIIAVDDLISSGKIKTPEMIKIDIQGFELEALKGSETTFGYTEVYILEASFSPFTTPDMPIFSDVVNFMLERDYVVYDFPGFLRRPLDGALGQCDICFVKRNGFLRKSNNW